MDIQKLVNDAMDALKADIASGDEVVTEVSPGGKTIRYSRKTAKARMEFLADMIPLVCNMDITAKEVTAAVNKFGRKTTKMFWIK